MNIKDLYIFQTVAQEGSFSKAAQRLNYVQSNITSRIQKLEELLATPLFHRHQRGVTLTKEGMQLLPYAQQILSLANEMEALAKNESNPVGKLNIASVETVIQLPLILSQYAQRYPDVDLTLSTGVTAELKDKVLQYELDGAFVTKEAIAKDPSLHQVDVFYENLVIISGKKNRSFEDIMQLPIIRFSDGCGYRAKLDEYLYDHRIVPTKVMELGTLETTLGSVISGLGIAYVPYAAIKDYEAKGLIDCYPLPEKYSKITTVFIYRNDPHIPPALKAFVETVKDVHRKLYKKE